MTRLRKNSAAKFFRHIFNKESGSGQKAFLKILSISFFFNDLEANLLTLKDWFLDLHVPDIYSISFSYKPDDLMMWRSYASPPTGICLGFNGDALVDAVELEIKSQGFGYVMGKTRYPKNAQLLKDAHLTPSTKNFLTRLKAECLAQIKKIALDPEHVCETQIWRELRDELDLHSIMYKHPAFKMEQEFRFAISNWSKKDLRYRQSGASFNSYCELKIPNLLSLIQRVIVGPTPEPERTLTAIRHFMDAKGVDLGRCSIEVSEIPYRAW